MDATQQSTPPHGDALVDQAYAAFNDGMRSHGVVHDRADLQAAHRAGVASVVAFMTDRSERAAHSLKAVA